MNKFGLRSRFLAVRLLIAAALTVAVILVVRFRFSAQAERTMRAELVACRERLAAGRDASQGPIADPTGTQWDTQARRFSTICGSDIVIFGPDVVLASTIDVNSGRALLPQVAGIAAAEVKSVSVNGQSFEASAWPLNSASVWLVALKPHEPMERMEAEFTRLMAGLAIAAMVVGFFLVSRVSDTFARPLGNLVEAVRALEKGDFDYPLKLNRRDELAQVTQAFDQMRSSLRESQKRLLEHERLATIGRMASSISHDLRHPLTAIVANSEFLSEENLPEEQRQNLHQEVRAAVEQMNDLIESLLEFSRGRESPHLVRVQLQDVAERAVRTVGARPEFQSVKIHIECPSPIECVVDPLKLERAIGNLLINACEACVAGAVSHVPAAGSGSVEISLRASEQAVEIRVTDDGTGVPETIEDTLFEPFVSQGKSNGTGLGLAVVRKICRDHGGDAALESSVAGRTVFKITLPRAA
jgi:signal transduction histidine kinase